MENVDVNMRGREWEGREGEWDERRGRALHRRPMEGEFFRTD